MNFIRVVKNIAKKVFLRSVSPGSVVEAIHRQIGSEWVADRTFYWGRERRRVKSLKMESAPGTSETVIGLLQKESHGALVLDFGCGQHQSAYLRRMGFRVHSCDIFDFAIPNYTKINPNDSKLPFADNSFDVTVVSEVIEHVEIPFGLLLEIARVTKKFILATSPNPQSLKSRQEFFKTGFLYWFAKENFAYHISPVFLWQMELFCKRHGFLLEKVLGSHEIFNLAGGKPEDMAEALIYKINVNKA